MLGPIARGLAAASLFLGGCGVVESWAASRCAMSDGCETLGECSVRFTKTGDGPWRCYAGSDEDCAASKGCRDGDACFATELGTCGTEAEVESNRCEGSDACRARGDCKPSGEGFCIALDDASCRASELCPQQGECGYIGESTFGGVARCGVTDVADCEKSEGCKARGDCGLWKGGGRASCAATSKAHCEQSRACADEEACELIEGRTLRQGRCVFIPDSDAECAASPGCRIHGACTMVPGDAPSDPPQCAPSEPGHCTASEDCTKDRKCTYWPRPAPEGKPSRGGSCGW